MTDRPGLTSTEPEQLTCLTEAVSTPRAPTDRSVDARQTSGSSTDELEQVDAIAPPRQKKGRKQRVGQRKAVVEKVRLDKGQHHPTADTSNDADKLYVVGRVVGIEEFRKGHRSFNKCWIKWKGYPESENTL